MASFILLRNVKNICQTGFFEIKDFHEHLVFDILFWIWLHQVLMSQFILSSLPPGMVKRTSIPRNSESRDRNSGIFNLIGQESKNVWISGLRRSVSTWDWIIILLNYYIKYVMTKSIIFCILGQDFLYHRKKKKTTKKILTI